MTIVLLAVAVVLGVGAAHRFPRSAPWVALTMGLVVVGQIWWARGDMAGYQVRVLGQRFALEEGVVRTISGDVDRSDIYVAGVAGDPVATLSFRRDTLWADAATGSGAVLLLRPRGPGSDWHVLGSVPLRDGDRVRVGEPAELEWVFRIAGSGLRGEVHEWIGAAGDATPVPYPEGAGLFALLPSRPDVFQRSYPLADLAAEPLAPGRGSAHLDSFLYYQNGQPRLAVLDPGLAVVSAGEIAEASSSVAVGSGGGLHARLLIAGLPYRDLPEPRLAEGERYGVRPFRALEPRIGDGWLTLAESRPRVVGVGPEDLTSEAGLWIIPGTGLPQPGAAQIAGYSNRFETISQALLPLPEAPDGGPFRILTPSGLADGALGRPFTLGDGDRGLLLRVDGFGVSPPLLLTILGLFALAALAFPVVGTSAGGASLALAALGLVAVRTLASLATLVRYPYVEEGHHLSLWLIPAVPWLVAGASRVVASRPPQSRASVSVVNRGFSGGFMGAPGPGRRWGRGGLGAGWITGAAGAFAVATLVLLSRSFFPASPAKSIILAALPVALAVALLLGRHGVPYAHRVRRWAPAWTVGSGRRFRSLTLPGLGLGVLLLGMRAALSAAGFREQVTVGGTRIGLSVFYTPAVVLCFALVLWLHIERVNRENDTRRAARQAALAWVDTGAFLVLSLAVVSLWISDFGIILTTLPGPAALMAVLGVFWSRRLGPGAAVGGLLPLALFLLIQLSPGMLRPVGAEASAAAATTRLEEWSRNELLLLERGDPELLGLIGESRSEALAVMRETMRSYTRGNWTGKGFLKGRVSAEIRGTASREHASGALVASQWGLLGSAGLVAMLVAMLLPYARQIPVGGGRPSGLAGVRAGRVLPVGFALGLVGVVLPSPASLAWVLAWTAMAAWVALWPLLPAGRGRGSGGLWAGGPGSSAQEGTARYGEEASWEGEADPPHSSADLGWIVGATAVASLVGAGLYMVLANYGLVLFTGKNVYLLGLDSVGDTLEALALLGLGAVGLGLASGSAVSSGRRLGDGSVALEPVGLRQEWRRVG